MLDYVNELSEIIKDTELLDKYFGGWAYPSWARTDLVLKGK